MFWHDDSVVWVGFCEFDSFAMFDFGWDGSVTKFVCFFDSVDAGEVAFVGSVDLLVP